MPAVGRKIWRGEKEIFGLSELQNSAASADLLTGRLVFSPVNANGCAYLFKSYFPQRKEVSQNWYFNRIILNANTLFTVRISYCIHEELISSKLTESILQGRHNYNLNNAQSIIPFILQSHDPPLEVLWVRGCKERALKAGDSRSVLCFFPYRTKCSIRFISL